ncbi:ninjurin-related [Holotrichia oblita]|uniref:Ninjurin-related n=1 Tax=Holotrichia oblita TaxID=644536 RepID=A0ACB9TEE2_HOLOL|nr:ninjurin-related [Holotrichia oblita]
MELNNSNGENHKEHTIPKIDIVLSDDEEKKREDAMGRIFLDHDFYDRSGEMNDDNKSNMTDLSNVRSNHFDLRSEYGGTLSIPDVNTYQNKKTVAQGMMDLALFSANANQLRYVVESINHPYYYSGIVLITISLIFQVAVGVGLLINTRYSVKCRKEICIANKINNFTVVGIFLVTIVNVFISAFGVATNGTIPLANRFGDEDDMNITTIATIIE